jgi:ribonuclease H2 subunit B
LLTGHPEITPEISVYRFSSQILVEYLRKKVARLVAANEFRESLTVVRLLAKDGLMEDGNEALLEGKLYSTYARRVANTLLAGRLKAACDLVAHHLPPSVKTELISTYEYADPSLKPRWDAEFLAASRPWTFT